MCVCYFEQRDDEEKKKQHELWMRWKSTEEKWSIYEMSEHE